MLGTSPSAYAACTSNAPASNTVVTCTGPGTSPGVIAPAATGVTVGVLAGAHLDDPNAAISLGANTTINNDGQLTSAFGTGIAAGTNAAIINSGTISLTNLGRVGIASTSGTTTNTGTVSVDTTATGVGINAVSGTITNNGHLTVSAAL